jgi:hypothetical protein
MSAPSLDQARSLLVASRSRFEGAPAGKLYGAMMVSSRARMSSAYVPLKGPECLPDRETSQRTETEGVPKAPTQRRSSLPLPARLWFKPVWDLHDDTVIDLDYGWFTRRLFLIGDDEAARLYREMLRPAARVLLWVMHHLAPSPARECLLEVTSHFIYKPTYKTLWAGIEDDTTLWTLAVHGLLDVEDQHLGAMMERWAYATVTPPARRPGGLPDRPTQTTVQVEDEAPEKDLAKKFGTVLYVTVNDLFVSSARAIDVILRLLDSDIDPAGPPGSKPPAAPGYLGLIIDENNKTISKAGRRVTVSLAGHELAWGIFLKLDRNCDSYCPREALRAVWNDHGVATNPTDEAMDSALTKLRGLLKPLGVTVENRRKTGWRLTDTSQPTRPSN